LKKVVSAFKFKVARLKWEFEYFKVNNLTNSPVPVAPDPGPRTPDPGPRAPDPVREKGEKRDKGIKGKRGKWEKGKRGLGSLLLKAIEARVEELKKGNIKTRKVSMQL
jgi:hypothetical protein